MYNKKDMPALLEKLKGLIDKDGNCLTPDAQSIIDRISGPGTGLLYEYDEERLHLADGYVFDANGNIVKEEDITGSGVQK